MLSCGHISLNNMSKIFDARMRGSLILGHPLDLKIKLSVSSTREKILVVISKHDAGPFVSISVVPDFASSRVIRES